MKLDQALIQFYQESGFDLRTGEKPAFVDVFVGCMLIPLPNLETRRKYIKYHDLHHIINGFDVSQMGEGEVSAWEIGTGSFLHPILLIMNLIAISTALAIYPNRVLKAYLLGCKSKNLYCYRTRRRIDNGELSDINQIKQEFVNCRCSDGWIFLKIIPFIIFSLISVILHIILVIPALIYKKIWGKFFGNEMVKIVKIRK